MAKRNPYIPGERVKAKQDDAQPEQTESKRAYVKQDDELDNTGDNYPKSHDDEEE